MKHCFYSREVRDVTNNTSIFLCHHPLMPRDTFGLISECPLRTLLYNLSKSLKNEKSS